MAQRPTDYILVTIRITIQIRESVPDHYPDLPGCIAKNHSAIIYYAGVWRRSMLSEYF